MIDATWTARDLARSRRLRALAHRVGAAAGRDAAPIDPETSDLRTFDPKTIDPKTIDPKTIDPQAIEEILLLDAGRRPTPAAPLVVIVHPGDYDGNRAHMTAATRTLARLLRDAPDVAIVHRESCALAPLATAFRTALTGLAADPGRARVYYDPSTARSLTEIARDIAASYAGTERRRAVFLGAYADPDHGCVTHVWRTLVAAGLPASAVEVSPRCLTAGELRDTPDGPAPSETREGA